MYLTSRQAAAVAGVALFALVLAKPPRWLRSAGYRVAPLTSWHTSEAGRVAGRVIDEQQQAPVPAASVTVTGSSVGQTTSDDGTFSLVLPAAARTLTVRRIGYRPATIRLEPGETYYPVTLHRDVLRLETQSVTGAITSVSTNEAAMPADVAAAPSAPAVATFKMAATGVTGLAGSDAALATGAAMIVRTGGASIEVSTIDSAVPRLRTLAAAVGGYVANSAIQGGREQARTATLEVKVPAPSFDRLLGGLAPLGRVESVNVSAADVGEEYVDVEARIANDHRLEARLIELLATRTGKLKDVLDVEQELARVREEIERYEGRLRYLRTHTELSTLTVTIHEPIPIIDHVGTNPITAAARQAWQNFVALIAFAVASLGVVLPLAVIAGGAWWLFGRRRPAPPPATAAP